MTYDQKQQIREALQRALALLDGMPTEPGADSLTVKQFAARIGRNPRFVLDRIRAGLIKPLKVGKPYRIPASQLPK